MRILVLAHNHPEISPGGGEKAAYILFESFRRTPGVEAFFLARGETKQAVPGRAITAYPGRKNEYFLHTSSSDPFYISCRRPETYRAFEEFLREIRPDVIHFHHYLHFGVELLRVARNVMPNARIALTLHEFLAICYRDGQMVKAGGTRLCYSSSPLDCSRCFPKRSAADFFLRATYVRRLLLEADFFVIPSRFLRDRYLEWGLPVERMVLLPYGAELSQFGRGPGLAADEVPNVFGYFGRINDYKGVDVLISAVEAMTPSERAQVQIEVFGTLSVANDLLRKTIEDGFSSHRITIRFNGSYVAEELTRLMRRVHWVVVPSIWWENAPLVIDEAFGCGKPVICSNIGGMAEKVRDGVDGVHFDVGNYRSLARTMLKHASDKETYLRMVGNIKMPMSIDDVAAEHMKLYNGSYRAGAPLASALSIGT